MAASIPVKLNKDGGHHNLSHNLSPIWTNLLRSRIRGRDLVEVRNSHHRLPELTTSGVDVTTSHVTKDSAELESL